VTIGLPFLIETEEIRATGSLKSFITVKSQKLVAIKTHEVILFQNPSKIPVPKELPNKIV
jgi:hypothetical protein